MLKTLSQDIAVNLKDRLRDVRHFLRARRHDRLGAAPRSAAAARLPFQRDEVEGLIGHAASVVDNALTLAESLSRPFRPAPGGLHGFSAYLADDGDTRLFRRDMYAAARAALATFGETGALVHEAEFLTAFAALRMRHAGLVAAIGPGADDPDAAASLSAAMFLMMLEARPIALPERDAPRETVLNWRVLGPLALAAGVATLVSDAGDKDILDAAIMAAEARRDRIAEALESADPLAEITRLFRQLLPHLP